MPKASKSAARAASTLAGAEALGLRVAELEAQLADERSRASTKGREVQQSMQILRSAMQDMQSEVDRTVAEREALRGQCDRLEEQLAEARRNPAEVTAVPAAQQTAPRPSPRTPDPRVAELDRLLDEARLGATSLRERVAVLEALVSQRERDLVEARDAAAALEAELASAPTAAADRPAPGDASASPAAAPEPTAAHDTPEVAPAQEVGDDEDTAPVGPSDESAEWVEDADVATHEVGSETPSEDSPDALPDIPGTRIERRVENGPGGQVYDGRDQPTRRAVTVLVLPGIVRLLEGGTLDSLLLARHPNLVAVLSFGVCRSGPYLVLERSDGETGDAWVERIGPLPEPTVLAVALEAARGLRHAAANGAHHGDLSPASVVVDATGRVRVRGAGMRPVLRPNDDAPAAPEYAAPECLSGASAPDARSDIYSLGAVLWFLLTGSPPPRADDSPQDGAPAPAPDVSDVRDDVSQDTAKLLRKMLAADRGERHRTWDQLLIDLENRQPGVVTPGLRSSFEARARRVFADKPWLMLLLIAVPLVCALTFHLAIRRDTTPEERWAEARQRAKQLIEAGDREGARQIYRRFLEGVGDNEIEADAARRFEALKR